MTTVFTGPRRAAADTLDDLAELVHAHAMARPEAPALVLPDRTLRYAELDAAAEALATVLRAAGVGPGTVVPVVLPPSADLVVAVVAVLKAGGAYAALDVGWPEERMRRIGVVLAGQVAVTGPGPAPWFPDRVVVDRPGPRVEVAVTPRPIVGPEAAMVFFTSGSTGEPKAVVSPHRAVARLFLGPTFARFDETTVLPQTAPVAWDGFALELWGALVAGGACVLHTDRPLTPAGLRALVCRGVNTVFLTTSLFHLVVDEDIETFTGLRTVMVGGEKLSAAHAARFRARWPAIQLINGYGPAECAVFVLTHEIGDVDGDVPLGVPVPRTTVYVLRDGAPVPDGEVGELCVAGDGLALGYLGDPELTARRFTVVDLDGVPTRIYRTGDLGVVGPDGLVHFRGRLDRQVKRRGHRIELVGIERLAAGLPGVARCAVVPRLDGNGNCAELVLCYVPAKGAEVSPADISVELARSLPAQQLPDRVVGVATFPLSANGKLDTAALLDGLAPVADGVLRTATERLVATEVRALNGGAGVHGDVPLSALGIDSLAAIRLCGRLSTRFARVIPMSRLLGGATVAALAAWLDGGIAVDVAAVDSVTAPLTPMQHGFVYRHLLAEGDDQENHCLLSWTVTGDLDPDRLGAAVVETHLRHGYLAGRYDLGETPVVSPSGRVVELECHEGGHELFVNRLRAPFDLEEGLVWRAVLVRAPDAWLFGVAVHHAAFDGWSQHLLAADLSAAYAGVASPPPPAPPQVRALLDAGARAADVAAQREFWRTELAGLPELHWVAGPEDDPEDGGPEWLEVQAPPARLADVLAATHATLWELTGQPDFAVGVPVNRRGSAELQRAIGCLIDTVCVRLRPNHTDPGPALRNADVPFAEVLRLARPRRTGRHPLYQVIVAVQDGPIPRLDLNGCTTEQHPRHDAAWSHTELLIELFPNERRLRITRDTRTVPTRTMTATAEKIAARLGTAMIPRPHRDELPPNALPRGRR